MTPDPLAVARAEVDALRAELARVSAELDRLRADPTGWAEVTRGLGSAGPACPYCLSHRRDEHGHCATCGSSL